MIFLVLLHSNIKEEEFSYFADYEDTILRPDSCIQIIAQFITHPQFYIKFYTKNCQTSNLNSNENFRLNTNSTVLSGNKDSSTLPLSEVTSSSTLQQETLCW